MSSHRSATCRRAWPGRSCRSGNPALWWGFLLLTPLLVAGTVLRDRRSAVPLVLWLATWLPWLAVSRTAFLFYMVPAVPLMAVGTVVAVHRLGSPSPARRTYLGAVAGAVLPLAVLGALVWFDVIAGLRWVFGAGALGWGIGAVIGAVADHQADAAQHSELVVAARGAADSRTTLRWAVLVTWAVLAVAVWFAPVWLAIPLDDEAVRSRWWFDTWI